MPEAGQQPPITRPEPVKPFIDAADAKSGQWWRQVLSEQNGAFILSLKNGNVPPPPENASSSEFQDWLLNTIDAHIRGKREAVVKKNGGDVLQSQYDAFHEINPSKAGLILGEYTKSMFEFVKADRENREDLAIERFGEMIAYSTLLDAFGMTKDVKAVDALCSWQPGFNANTRINRIMHKLYPHKDNEQF